jgi:UDP-glucose 4-epimerase
MDLIHVEDIARANLLAAQAPVTDAVFNVGTGTEVSLRALLATLMRTMGSSLAPRYAPARKVNPVVRRVAATDQAWFRLGFRAQISLEAGLKGLVEWWQQERCATR